MISTTCLEDKKGFITLTQHGIFKFNIFPIKFFLMKSEKHFFEWVLNAVRESERTFTQIFYFPLLKLEFKFCSKQGCHHRQGRETSGLYYKHILTIASDDRK
jgi:hypothetical protein